jgi:hypothetical protein
MTFFVSGALALLAFLAWATWRSALVLREIAPIISHYVMNLAQLTWASKDRSWEHYDPSRDS